MRNKSVGVGVVNTNSIVKDVTKFIILVIIMSEKRFKLSDWCGERSVSNVIDIEKQTHLANIEVLDLLNEQQARIKELEEENDILEQKLQTRYIVNKQYEEKEKLKKENEQLRRELDGFHPVMFQDMRRGTVVLYLKELE